MTENTLKITPEAQALAETSEPILHEAQELIVDSPEMYEYAGGQLTIVNGKLKEVEAMRKTMKAPILEAGRGIDSFFNVPKDRLTKAVNALKKSMLDYNYKIQQEQREAQRKADEEARKRQAEIDQKALEEAAAASESGDEEKAAAIIENREHASVPIVAPTEQPKAAGTSISYRYSAKVTDLQALVNAVAAGKAPLSTLQADGPALNKLAVALRDELNYPGVEVVKTPVMSARSA